MYVRAGKGIPLRQQQQQQQRRTAGRMGGSVSGGAAFRSSGPPMSRRRWVEGVCAQRRWRPLPPVHHVCAVPDKHVLVRIAVYAVGPRGGEVLLGNTPGYPLRDWQLAFARRVRRDRSDITRASPKTYSSSVITQNLITTV